MDIWKGGMMGRVSYTHISKPSCIISVVIFMHLPDLKSGIAGS